PLQLWAGHFDLVFVLVYLLPLFLMLLSFDLHTTEQQNGTLRLLMMQAGHLGGLLFAKTLARLLILSGFLLALTLWVWLLLRPWLDLDWSWSHWFLLLAVVMVYGAFWLLLAAWLNCFRWPAVQVATSLATLWLLWSWLLPATGQQALQTLYPVPSRLAYLQQQREALESARRNSDQLLGAYLEDHPELADGADNRYAMLQLSKAQRMARAVRPLVQQYQQQLARQQALASAWIYLSPVSLLEQALMHLAGSDMARYEVFEVQAHAFQKDWQAFFMPLITQGRALNSADFARLPAFVDAVPDTRGQIFWRLSASLLVLLVLVLGLTWRAWRRYPVI
ncbi:MAG: DUF3526 domain-containing protein, partial [Candidatus Sericytochromatia bacterium]|nr:DUF3526 domain-containing protein [Candidatus Sericytochromatia bacterium]